MFQKYWILPQNPKLVAFSFNGTCMFLVKTDRKLISLLCVPYSQSTRCYDVVHVYLNVWNNIEFCLKCKAGSFWFYQKCLYTAKMRHKSVFLIWESHFPARLYTAKTRHKNFYIVWKNIKFHLKIQKLYASVLTKIYFPGLVTHYVVIHMFLDVLSKNTCWHRKLPKICLFWKWVPDSDSLKLYADVDNFLFVFKNIKFCLRF
jgi:hypothetical protein